MLLVIDAGNTNITVGAYNGDDLVFVSRLATDRTLTEDRIAIDVNSIFSLYNVCSRSFRGAIISSVVPELTLALKNAVARITGHVPYVVGPGIKTGLNIRIDNPAELGSDLVAGAVGAICKYELPCLVIDLGTATKISVVDENAAYRGCTISPGVAISLAALANGASQLSHIALLAPTHAIGTNTIDCMRVGSVFGTADMLDGLCDRLERELEVPVKTIVATGGLCSIAKHCRHDIVFNETLLLEGLKAIYERNDTVSDNRAER